MSAEASARLQTLQLLQSTQSSYQIHTHAAGQIKRERLIRALHDGISDAEATSNDTTAHALFKLAKKILTCCQWPVVKFDEDGSELCIAESRCKSRLCPRCQRQRANQLIAKLTEATKRMDSPRFITLTLKSRPAGLRNEIKRLSQAFHRMRRHKLWKAHFTGGAYVIEVTYNRKLEQWHPHLHCIIDGTYIVKDRLSQAWLEATGDSSIVDIKKVNSASAIARYVTRYVGKTSDVDNFPDHALTEWALATVALRTCSTFGTLHGVKLTEHKPASGKTFTAVAPIAPLHEQAHAGNPEARRLYTELQQLSRRQIPNGGLHHNPPTATQQRDLVERLRTWWRSYQDARSDLAPIGSATGSRMHNPDHRPVGLWQKSTDPPPD